MLRIWCVVALVPTLPLLAAGTRLLRAPDGDWKGMPCFMDLARYGLTASEDDVIYRQDADGTGPVLVIQTKPAGKMQRTLVFQDGKGRCNGQAGTLCAQSGGTSIGSGATFASSSSALDADAADLSAVPGAKDFCGDTSACSADVSGTIEQAGGGYVRSMAGALHDLSMKQGGKGLDILAVGLGAGTLPLLVQQKFHGARQTVVELSGGVVGAARCFGVGTDLNIVQADGRSYLESAANASYDALLVDVFDGDDKVPPCFTTEEFFATTRRVLRPGGTLVMNAHSGKTLHNDLRDILPGLHGAFSDVKLGVAPGLANVIVRATNPVAVSNAGADGDASGTAGVAFLAAGTELDGDVEPDSDLESWFQQATFTADATSSSSDARRDAGVGCQA